MRGMGFEPDCETVGLTLFSRCDSRGSNQTDELVARDLASDRVRGMGFEPMDPYGSGS